MTTVYTREDFINNNDFDKNKLIDLQNHFKSLIVIIDTNFKKSNYKPIPKFKKINISVLEKYNNEINSLLNKLSIKTFDKICNNIINYYNTNTEDLKVLLESTINNIFKKAVIQPNYCALYVKFIKKIDSDYTIKNLLEEKCNEYKSSINIEVKKTDDSMNEQEKYDLFCDNNKIKIFKEGYSQFMGELFNNDMITDKIIYDYLDFFITNLSDLVNKNKTNDMENIESNIISIYKLLTTCKNINIFKKKKNKKKISKIDKSKLNKRLQFKILDIIEL